MIRISFLAFLLLVGGCGGGRQGPFVTVLDSAGIQIVASSAPRWGDSTVWAVSDKPVLDLSASGTGRQHESTGSETGFDFRTADWSSLTRAARKSGSFPLTGDFSVRWAERAMVRASSGNWMD